MEGEFVEVVVEEDEGVAFFAGLEVPAAGLQEGGDQVHRVAGGQGEGARRLRGNRAGIDRLGGGVVERDGVGGAFVALLVGLGEREQATGGGVEEGFGFGFEGQQHPGESAGVGGRGHAETWGGTGGVGGGGDLDFARAGQNGPGHLEREGFAVAQGERGLGRERETGEQEEGEFLNHDVGGQNVIGRPRAMPKCGAPETKTPRGERRCAGRRVTRRAIARVSGRPRPGARPRRGRRNWRRYHAHRRPAEAARFEGLQ